MDPDSDPTLTYYDFEGQVTGTLDADQHLSQTFYDPDGRVVGTMDGDQHSTTTYYDAAGLVTETIDGRGQPTKTYYDLDGEVTDQERELVERALRDSPQVRGSLDELRRLQADLRGLPQLRRSGPGNSTAWRSRSPSR